MKKGMLYIHGKGGNAAEAAHYVPLFPEWDVVGFDYISETPWDARKEFALFYDRFSQNHDIVGIIANSIGAFFSLHGLFDKNIRKAYFISPIVDMEPLITDRMNRANVTEDILKNRQRIETAFGETISWDYLCWIRNHAVSWNIPTRILYGANDRLQPFSGIQSFALQTGADITVMQNGEHWFHTREQMAFLDNWMAAGEAHTTP